MYSRKRVNLNTLYFFPPKPVLRIIARCTAFCFTCVSNNLFITIYACVCVSILCLRDNRDDMCKNADDLFFLSTFFMEWKEKKTCLHI